MSRIDIDALSRPVSDAQPCGDNLEYDPRFVALERAAEGRPGAQYGETIIDAVPPDWKTVSSLALDLLAQTRDLRVASVLTHASLALEGMPGLLAGLNVIAGWLDAHWPDIYPRIDPDDHDPAERVNALLGLTDTACLNDLKASVLLKTREHGQFTAADLAALTDDGNALGGVRAALATLGPEASTALCMQWQDAADALARIEQRFREALDGDFLLDLGPLRKAVAATLTPLRRLLPQADADDVAGDAAADDTRSVATDAARAGAVAPATGIVGVENRRDVLRAIDCIRDYYGRHEPSSPIPLMLQRTRRMVEMNFLDLMGELVPDALEQTQTVLGVKSLDVSE